MQIRVGHELVCDCPQSTPMILTLHIHSTRVSHIVVPDHLTISPSIPITAYRDAFDNWCSRIVAPTGELRLSAAGSCTTPASRIRSPSGPISVRCKIFPKILQGSRYCETDLLSEAGWSLFDDSPPGWRRVQAICDFVHKRLTFGYQRRGCRDQQHLRPQLAERLQGLDG